MATGLAFACSNDDFGTSSESESESETVVESTVPTDTGSETESVEESETAQETETEESSEVASIPPGAADRVLFDVVSVRVTELGQNELTFGIRLSRQPDSTVTVEIEATDPTEAVLVGSSSFVFTADDWDAHQWVTVGGVDDDELDYRQESQVRVVSVTTEDPAFLATSEAHVKVFTYDDEYIQRFEDEDRLECYQYSCELSFDGRYLLATGRGHGPSSSCDQIPVYYDRYTALVHEIVTPPGGACPDGGANFGHRIAGRPTRIAFDAGASNWVSGDTNGVQDVFFYDDVADAVELVSMSHSGGPSNGASYLNAVSDDGRYVVFTSAATNLVAAQDSNDHPDVFVRDRTLGVTRLVSRGLSGETANERSGHASMLRDGSFIYFDSLATDLVPGGQRGMFEFEVATGDIRWIDVGSAGAAGFYRDQTVARDGGWLFTGYAGAPVDGIQPVGGWATDLVEGGTTFSTDGGFALWDTGFGWSFGYPSASDDGSRVAFVTSMPTGPSGDFRWEVAYADRDTADVHRISMAPGGVEPDDFSQSPVVMSGNGEWVMFSSNASNLTPSYLGDHIAKLADLGEY